MDMHTRLLVTCLVLACLLPHSSPTTTTTSENHDASSQRTYIVRVRPPSNFSTNMAQAKLEKWYRSFLPPRMAMANPPSSPFIHTYNTAMLGFAAKLTEGDAEYVRRKNGVLKVYQDVLLPLLTTHTPDFLGLRRSEEGAWSSAGMGEGIIIGILDTGIDSAHTSFDDSGMHPPPARWRGSCNFTEVKCNNKLIGAKSFVGSTESASTLPPVDHVGHGTHTAGTAAGRFVQGASVLGNGNGTAAGMAPHAHIAVYQVCTREGCASADILAGMDAAIADGVDVMSLL